MNALAPGEEDLVDLHEQYEDWPVALDDQMTGTGYNAALLSERLDSDNVTSIDIDHELITLARQRLHDVGYRPLCRRSWCTGLPCRSSTGCTGCTLR